MKRSLRSKTKYWKTVDGSLYFQPQSFVRNKHKLLKYRKIGFQRSSCLLNSIYHVEHSQAVTRATSQQALQKSCLMESRHLFWYLQIRCGFLDKNEGTLCVQATRVCSIPWGRGNLWCRKTQQCVTNFSAALQSSSAVSYIAGNSSFATFLLSSIYFRTFCSLRYE